MKAATCCIVAFAAALSAGCASKYTQDILVAPSRPLVKGKSVLVATPANSVYYVYAGRNYKKSGVLTASAVRSAFGKFSSSADISPVCTDISCLVKSSGYDYYVVPEILHWEFRDAEWRGPAASLLLGILLPSEQPADRINIKIKVFDAGSQEVASATITGKTNSGIGGPEDLLPEPINNYVASIYGYSYADQLPVKMGESVVIDKKDNEPQSTSTSTAETAPSSTEPPRQISALASEPRSPSPPTTNVAVQPTDYPSTKPQQASAPVSQQTTNASTLKQGSSAYAAEELAKRSGCTTKDGLRPYAAPLQISGAIEVYDIECTTKRMTVRCDRVACKALE